MLPVRALSIRQPYAELILRGIKRIEYRSRATRIIGERFWIYASKGRVSGFGVGGSGKGGMWSGDLAGQAPPPWMIELAEAMKLWKPGELGGLPRGVIVGSAVIEKVTPGDGIYHWHLREIQRTPRLRKPRGRPQPVWFKAF
jgi:hypothetical protein